MVDMLSKAGMLECIAVDAPMKANVKLLLDQRELSDNPDRYH